MNIKFNAGVSYSKYLLPILTLSLSLFMTSCSEEATSDDLSESMLPSITLPVDHENLPLGGTLTSNCNDSEIGCGLSNLVDGNRSTKYTAMQRSVTLTCYGKMKMTLQSYTITVPSDNSETEDPYSWTLEASNSTTNWVVIDSQENITFKDRGQSRMFTCINDTEYKNYRIRVSKNNGASKTSIAEWYVCGNVKGSISDLMTKASGTTSSTQTPMGPHYENAIVADETQLAWLADPQNEPAVPNWSWTIGWNSKTVTLYPYGEPVPADVNQHAIGDCCALAVLASYAYIYPDFIKSIITDNGNNTYTVKMFDPKGNRIDVGVKNTFLVDGSGNIGQVTGKNNKATWATVLEKAMIKWENVFQVNPDINGIGTEHASPLFTGDGYSFAFYPGVLTNTELKRVANTTVDMGYIVVGGFNRPDLSCGTLTTVTGHAFTIMYGDNASHLFVMRNPWGNGNSGEDGKLLIPNNSEVPPTIDLRICNPGAAAPYQKRNLSPYLPPKYTSENEIGVSEFLLRTGM